MRAYLWSCLLEIFCIPAVVVPWTVSQHPPVVSLTINSSADVLCSTSLLDPLALSLRRYLRHDSMIAYLSLEKKRVTKATTSEHLQGRFDVLPKPEPELGFGLTLRLSPLELTDTDIYYCSWTYFNATTFTKESLQSKGTLIIVRETDPEKLCDGHKIQLILVSLITIVFVLILSIVAVALAWKCTKFRKVYRPTGRLPRSIPRRYNQTYTQQTSPHVYSSTAPCSFDFRGIS
ncbi:uncharacterized protein LOC130127973 [Lampris incognitus]|uniref:uncharacterized protein LOC130127973 n=1 Tax=Lampris incognitus TaxID=2546036 RepID=UPI0024B51AC5|nr:uncharacterized protein LOC130127973 [Lampris incognitus]